MNMHLTSRTRARWSGLAAGLLALTSFARAQTVEFNAGSTGALGDVVITNDTQIVLPADGVLHYKSFTIVSNAAVSFIKNANNTPVYLLSQGEVTIGGRIYVSGGGSGGDRGPGLGGIGGFDGGRRGVDELPPGDGQGPGGGLAGTETDSSDPESAGSGSFLTMKGNGSTNLGAIYGNAALIPLIGGSGGGGTPTFGGGGGGGAILIASNSKITINNDGTSFIDATGGEWGTGGAFNGGSGGAVKLVAPQVTGPIRIYVQNRNGTGGSGRIRLDAVNYSGAQFNHHSPASSLSYGSMLATGIEGNLPQLELVSVAGKALPTGNLATGFILLPNGVSGDQPVVVRARNFGSQVPIRVVIAPDNGKTAYVDGVIVNTGANAAEVTIAVNIPANSPAKINVWTR